jgi:hypothetical protein
MARVSTARSQIVVIVFPTLAFKNPVMSMERVLLRRVLFAAVGAGEIVPLENAECLAGFHLYNPFFLAINAAASVYKNISPAKTVVKMPVSR